MKRQALKDNLYGQHRLFIAYVVSLTDEEFLKSFHGKWTAGQQLSHILLSIKPLMLVLRLPKFMLKMFFGLSVTPSRSYTGLVHKYLGKLQNGGRATGRFVPEAVSADQKEKLIRSLEKAVKKLCAEIDQFTEDELDLLILPHPLLGKLTIREMIYFTVYHVKHHYEQTMQNLKNIHADNTAIKL